MDVKQLFSLSGKAALVTGAGSGIGQAIGEALLEAGADLAALYRSHYPTPLEQKAEALGRRFVALHYDMADHQSWQAAVDKTAGEFGRLDILVCNAGTTVRKNTLDFEKADWDAVIDVNEKAVFFLGQAAARHFAAQQSGGKIINIASMLSFHGGQNCPAYAASKHAVLGITRTMALDLADKNIQVNAIAPGWIATDLTQALRQNEKRNEQIIARIPAGGWGSPDDIKGTAVFLASAASDYITGACIPVDGGYLVK